MFQTLVMRPPPSDSRGVKSRISNLSGINAVLLAGVILVVIAFFWWNPFRVGEITLTTPNGPSVTFKVAESIDISDLIRRGLEDTRSEPLLTNSLLSIIENLRDGSKLANKLVDLAEQRKSPFASKPVFVKLVHDSEVPKGVAAVCEESGFSAKNIAIFLFRNNELLDRAQAYVDPNMMFPCPEGPDTVRLNSKDLVALNPDKVMVKRAL